MPKNPTTERTQAPEGEALPCPRCGHPAIAKRATFLDGPTTEYACGSWYRAGSGRFTQTNDCRRMQLTSHPTDSEGGREG